MTEPEKRVFYKDLIPYDTPDSLDDLKGPTSGVVELPLSVETAPDPRVDLSTRSGRHNLVRAVVQNGTVADQIRFLNADLLRQVWPEIRLPQRCRDAWESRFPELARIRQHG